MKRTAPVATAAGQDTDDSDGTDDSRRAPRPRLRLVKPPATEPPTDAPSGGRAAASLLRTEPVQGTLALLFTVPGGAPAEPAPARDLRLVARAGSRRTPVRVVPDDEDDADCRVLAPTARADLPEPRRWTARLVQAAVEARYGDRPVAQLSRWTTRPLYERLAREIGPTVPNATARRGTVRPVVRSLHLTEPADGVVEACAVLHDRGRRRAVALRLEGLDGRWLCTELDIL